jgi:hypothetical protein
MEMCGENQKTLKFHIQKGQEERQALCLDAMFLFKAQISGAPWCLRSAGRAFTRGAMVSRETGLSPTQTPSHSSTGSHRIALLYGAFR